MWDVFLSYAGADREQAIAVRDALSAAEISVWFDEHDLRDHETITEKLADGLAKSRSLLALYTDNYHRRRACQWELVSAWLAGEAEAHRGQATRCGHRVMAALYGHGLPKGLEGHKRFANPKDLPALVAGVKDYLANVPPRPMGTLRAPGRAVGVPLSPSRFVGRTDEMWQIHTGLQGNTTILSGATDSASGGYGLMQVRGCGGMGKTLLATEYVSRFGAAWPGGVYWLRATGKNCTAPNEERLVAQLRETLIALHSTAETKHALDALNDTSPQEKALYLKGMLSQALPSDRPWLWVVDDLPLDLDEDQARLWTAPSVAGNWGCSLFTTRNQGIGGVGQTITLQELGPEAALSLITARIPPQSPSDKDAARGLAHTLGYYALALDIAGALREKKYPDYHALAEALAKAPHAVYDNRLSADLPGAYSDNILKALHLSLMACPPETLTTLKIAAHLAPGVPIPCTLLEAAGATHALYHADNLQKVSLGLLMENSLTLHAAVTHTVRLSLPGTPSHKAALAEAIIAVFEAAKPYGTLQSQQTLEPYFAHVETLCAEATTETEIRLRIEWGDSLDSCGLFTHARTVKELNLTLARTHLSKDHELTLTAMDRLAATLWALGEHAAARALQEDTLDLLSHTLGTDHQDTLTAMNNLALTVRSQGKLSYAAELFEDVFAARCRLLSAEHPDTLTTMNDLALTLCEKSDLSESWDLMKDVVTLRCRIFGAEHPETLTSMHNLAGLLWAQGKTIKALRLEEKVLERRRKVLGIKHPDTLNSINNLALTLLEVGDLSSAYEYQNEVLKQHIKNLSLEHPVTLTSMNNLAMTLWFQERFSEARDLQEQVLSKRNQVLGPEHPETFNSQSNLACTLWKLGDHDEALRLGNVALDGLIRTLGPNHPHTEHIRKIWAFYKNPKA